MRLSPSILLDVVSTVVYSRHYYGGCPEWIIDAARVRLGSIYLLLDIDIAWIADGVRDRPEERESMQQLFRRELRELGANAVQVSGLGELRLQRALRAVAQLHTPGA